MKTIRKQFVKDFGELMAVTLEIAAESHINEVHNDKGSDPFKWVLLICIGYQCFEKPAYRKWHKIPTKPSFTTLKKWIRENADLGSHDGSCDYLSLFCGAYKPFIKDNEI